MLGDKIKSLRLERGLTQKDLADKLYVTPQAVSRWEKNEVEPSVSTLTEIANVLDVSVNKLMGNQETEEKIVEKIVYKEPKPVLAVCEQCKKPIYDGNDIVKSTNGRTQQSHTICRACHERKERFEHQEAVNFGIRQRNKSFIWGGIFTALILIFTLIGTISLEKTTGEIIGACIIALLFFPFLSCLYLKNNFIQDMFETIAGWSVKFPGLIYTLDLDGIIWLLTVKLAFWIIGILISIVCFLIAITLSLALSVFVYPFALVKSFKKPELAEDF